MSKFCVIGGQYAAYNYGETATLLGAKRLAGRHEEYWDNWGGWHVPAIYREEDCEVTNTFFGEQKVPRPMVEPVSVWNGKRWVDKKGVK